MFYAPSPLAPDAGYGLYRERELTSTTSMTRNQGAVKHVVGRTEYQANEKRGGERANSV